MQKTVSIQAGVETPVLGISGIHTDILNLTNGFVYASSKAGVVADADGVIAIPSMARALLLDSGGSAFILGTSEGKVQLQGSDNACVNFSSTPKGGDSPGGSGDNGATFTPVPSLISDNQLELSWVNDMGLTNPDPVTITAPAGATGESAKINGENAVTLTGYNGITVSNGADGDVDVTCNFFSSATGYLISATDAQDGVPFNSVKIKPASSSSTSKLIVAGRNLLPYPYYETSKVENGLTFTDNEDGSISVEGTATAETIFLLASRPSTDPVYLPQGDITLSGCPVGGEVAGYSIWAVSDVDDDGDSITFYDDGTGAGATNNLDATTPMLDIRIEVPDGTTIPGVTFYPQFEVGASSSTFRKGTVSTYSYSSEGEDEFTVTDLVHQVGPDMNVFTHSESCTATLSVNHNTNPQMATLQRQISALQDTVSYILGHIDNGDINDGTTDGDGDINDADGELADGELNP